MKNLRKLLGIVLCFVIVLGLLPATALAEGNTDTVAVGEVNIVGIINPVAGGDYNAPAYKVATVADDAPYTVESVDWFNEEGNGIPTETFEEGTKYRVRVILKPKEGYEFTWSDTKTIALNGQTGTMNKIWEDGTAGFLLVMVATRDETSAPNKGTFYVTKTDEARNPLAGASFKLENTVAGRTDYTATSASDGKVTFADVVDGEYILSETAAPVGYTKSDNTVKFKVEEGAVYYYTDRYAPYSNTLSIVNTPKEAPDPELPATIDVTVVKEWDVPEGTVLPESILVNLIANDERVDEAELTANNNWTHTWIERPAATEDGASITYTVEEVEVKGYECSVGEAIETDTGIEIAITNTLKEDPTEDPDKDPTEDPDKDPTEDPDKDPTEDPDKDPTEDPDKDPTEDPDKDPTEDPDKDPTEDPDKDPTEDPDKDPTEDPDKDPAEDPEKDPDSNTKPGTDAKPDAGSNGSNEIPKTGDTSGILLWTVLLLMSATALIGVEIYRKRSVR